MNSIETWRHSSCLYSQLRPQLLSSAGTLPSDLKMEPRAKASGWLSQGKHRASMFSCQLRKKLGGLFPELQSHQGPLERAWEVSVLSIPQSAPSPCYLTFLVTLQLQIFASLQLPGAVCAVHHPGAPGTCQRMSPYLGECWELPPTPLDSPSRENSIGIGSNLHQNRNKPHQQKAFHQRRAVLDVTEPGIRD